MTQETIDLKATGLGEDGMVGKERWEEIQRLAEGGATISAIARRLDVDRKTVRGWLRKGTWKPYRRAAIGRALLGTHAEFLQERAAAVEYSAQILYQELQQQRGYTGSYATVRRFVRPLREAACRADLTWTRFETPPGQQSQIDWISDFTDRWGPMKCESEGRPHRHSVSTETAMTPLSSLAMRVP